MAIVADPLYPSTVPQVLSLSVGPADTAFLSIGTAAQGCVDNPGTTIGGCWGFFPTTNMYVETVFRVDTTAIASFATNGANVGFDSWSLGAFQFSKEVDFIENFSGVYVYDLMPNGSSLVQNAALSGNVTTDNNYHTMGFLVSGSAGANLITACPYWDGLPASSTCQQTVAGGFAQQLGYLILWNAYNEGGSGVVAPSGKIPEYVKAIRVWSCAGWNNTTPPTFNTSSTNSCSTASPPTTPPGWTLHYL
jgi:hypothetical protein